MLIEFYYIFGVFFSTAQHTAFANVPNYGSFADRLVDSLGYWERQAEIRRDARPNSGTNTTHATPAPNVRNTSAGAPSTSATSVAHNTPSSPPVAHHLTAQGGLTQTERD